MREAGESAARREASPSRPPIKRVELVLGGDGTAAARDEPAFVAPADRRVEAVFLGEVDERAAFGGVSGDAVEERRDRLRSLEAHVVERLVDHQLLHRELAEIGRAYV